MLCSEIIDFGMRIYLFIIVGLSMKESDYQEILPSFDKGFRIDFMFFIAQAPMVNYPSL